MNIRRWIVPKHRPGRGTMIVLAALVLFALGHALVLRLLAWPLLAGESSAEGDYFCIHGGEMGADGFEPFQRAAQWHRQRAGRRILLFLPHDSRIVEIGAAPSFEQMCRKELSKCGIPPADVAAIRSDALDAWGEAHALAAWLRQHPDATVRLACGSFGSGRLRYVLDQVLASADARRVRLAALPDPECPAETWWRSRRGVKDFMYAWLGLIYARTYGDSPRPDPARAAVFQEETLARIGEAPR